MKYVENDIARLGSTLTRIIVLCAVRESHRVAYNETHQLTKTLVRSLDPDRYRDLGTALDLSFNAAVYTGNSDWAYALMVASRVSQLLQTGYESTKIGEVIELASGIQSTDTMSELDRLLGSSARTMYASAVEVAKVGTAWIPVLDSALAQAVLAAMADGTTVSDAFIRATSAGTAYVVDLDPLSDHLDKSTLAVSSTVRATTMAKRFAVAARPVFQRYRNMSAETATALRLTALCLAADADAIGMTPVADMYRRFAAGVTLMERRANGESPTNETIILATG